MDLLFLVSIFLLLFFIISLFVSKEQTSSSAACFIHCYPGILLFIFFKYCFCKVPNIIVFTGFLLDGSSNNHFGRHYQDRVLEE